MNRCLALIAFLPGLASCETQTWERLMTEAGELRQAGRFASASHRYVLAEAAAAQTQSPALSSSVTRIAIGALRKDEGHTKDAERIWRTELTRLEAVPLTTLAPVLLHLGDLYTAQRRFRDAESLLLRCEALSRRNHDDSLASILMSLGKMYLLQGKFGQAAGPLERAMLQLQSTQDQTLNMAVVAHMLATVYSHLGRTGEADLFFEQSLSVAASNLSRDDPRLGFAMVAFAKHLRGTGRKQRAKELQSAAALLRGRVNTADYRIDINALHDSTERSGRSR